MSKDKDIEDLFRDSCMKDVELPENKETIKNVLLYLGYQKNKRVRHWPVFWKVAIFLSGFLSIAAIGFFLKIEDNEISGHTNTLGGIWSTYNDSLQGGTSTIWPPVSSMCQNNFVKSAPGYGNKGYAVQIKGVAGNTDSAFLGVKTFLSERATCPRCVGIDLRIYKGIRFKMKGYAGNGTLYFRLPHQSRTPSSDMTNCQSLTIHNDYQVDITSKMSNNWSDVSLVFKRDFNQTDKTPERYRVPIREVLEDANCIEWHWVGQPGQTIELWIDDVELY